MSYKIKDIAMKIMEASMEGIFIENIRGTIIACNIAAAKLFGYEQRELIGKNMKDLLADPKAHFEKGVYTKAYMHKNGYKEWANIKKDGTVFQTAVNLQCIESEGELYRVSFVRDMTREIALCNKMYYLSNYDELTGLKNRRAILEYAKQKEKPFFLGMIDMDDFKLTNDTFGHLAGDYFLRELGRLIKKERRLEAGRIGGEEFLIIFNKKTVPFIKEAKRLLDGILKEANDCLVQYGGIRFSGGITLCKNDEFLKDWFRVDELLYEAKRNGKNHIRVG